MSVSEAQWKFLIMPENKERQQLLSSEFYTSEPCHHYRGAGLFGFSSIMVSCDVPVKEITFTADYRVLREEENPFDFTEQPPADQFSALDSMAFKVEHMLFLYPTALTTLPAFSESEFEPDRKKSIFENLQDLNHWVRSKLHFKPNVTRVDSTLNDVLSGDGGVCQDFTHLFCAMARHHGIPARYVSGYLHQGQGFSGDMHMHAWVEAFIPGNGWKGFDPTNDLLCDHHHIKVCHGRDYQDCAPIRGVIFTSGRNETEYSVQVQAQQ
ncbi:transglutaminase-like domain-containing protein [Robertkochia aurantiaca]|uniref:transglutaminase-like domain-containing protein n=1 Tax=Robertkochia aurantiaca TaxID=2873700 RepID=UPI001CCE404B|nr:transglutaminase family protein [Robertkochia sp. 3YJGBD-33]